MPIQLNEKFKVLIEKRCVYSLTDNPKTSTPYKGRINLTISEIKNIIKKNGFIISLNRKQAITREIDILEENYLYMAMEIPGEYIYSPLGVDLSYVPNQ